MTKTLETLLMEREQLVHETARLGQEVRQLRQVTTGDAESQTAQILALKEIVAALTVRHLRHEQCSPFTASDGWRASPAARESTASTTGRHTADGTAATKAAIDGQSVSMAGNSSGCGC